MRTDGFGEGDHAAGGLDVRDIDVFALEESGGLALRLGLFESSIMRRKRSTTFGSGA